MWGFCQAGRGRAVLRRVEASLEPIRERPRGGQWLREEQALEELYTNNTPQQSHKLGKRV